MSEHTTSYLAARDEFVQLWGDMASSWGINKTMSQIHALLYAESDALHTDEIMSILSISRGNANMNVRRLLDWELIHKVQFEGDRKDYFQLKPTFGKLLTPSYASANSEKLRRYELDWKNVFPCWKEIQRRAMD